MDIPIWKVPHRRISLLQLVLLTQLAGFGFASQAQEGEHILFLHLQMKNDAVALVRSTLRPGHLKTSRAEEKRGRLLLELTTADGALVWSQVMDDPARRRYEYEDPALPGTLRVKEVTVTQTEFTVRVPFHPQAKHLLLHRLDKPSNRVEARNPGKIRTSLGRIELPAAQEAP